MIHWKKEETIRAEEKVKLRTTCYWIEDGIRGDGEEILRQIFNLESGEATRGGERTYERDSLFRIVPSMTDKYTKDPITNDQVG